MGRFERAALTAWGWSLEGLASLGEVLCWPALTDAAVRLWAPVMDRMDSGLNSR